MLPQDTNALWEFLFFPVNRMWLKNVIFAENWRGTYLL